MDQFIWRFAAIICCIFPVVLHAQMDSQKWVLVTAPEGVAVATISAADLEVTQDGRSTKKSQPVIQQAAPLRIGLVFDESGSGRHSNSPLHSFIIERVLDWAGTVLGQNKGDAFLVGFNDQIITSTEITTDVSQLRRAFKQLHPVGGSAIRDALIHSTQKFSALGPEQKPTARVVVLVSDGFDNASVAKERNAIESAQWFGVRVYAISFPSSEASAGKDLMERFPQSTGGKTFFPHDEAGVNNALTAIAHDLANSFLLGFTPEADDGKFHNLNVALPNAQLRFMPKFRTNFLFSAR